jgi:hypothetical protein
LAGDLTEDRIQNTEDRTQNERNLLEQVRGNVVYDTGNGSGSGLGDIAIAKTCLFEDRPPFSKHSFAPQIHEKHIDCPIC